MAIRTISGGSYSYAASTQSDNSETARLEKQRESLEKEVEYLTSDTTQSSSSDTVEQQKLLLQQQIAAIDQKLAALAKSTQDTTNTETADSVTSGEKTTDGTGIYSKESIQKTLEEMENQRLNAMQQMITDMLAKQSDAKGFSNLFDTEQSSDSLFASYKLKLELSAEITVSEQDKQDAADSISADGYWSSESVSDRILEMAELLANGDSEKLSTLKDAILKGFEGAVSLFGKDSLDDMPEITSQTYDLVMNKFDKWEKSFSEDETTETDA